MSIVFQNVSKAFGSKQVLKNVSFTAQSGKNLFILGKSGVGKSVTLKQIVGLVRPDSGKIWIDNQDVTLLKATEWTGIRKKCGMVFQHPALFDSLSVFENLAFGLRGLTGSLSRQELRNKLAEKLRLVHLNLDVLDRMPSELSYGMQKRVSLARTLVPEPDYLLFDEPTTGLDPISTESINDLILDLSNQLKVTSIVVSHDMHSALKVADQVLFLDQAHVLAQGSVEEIKNSNEPLVRAFLAEALEFPPDPTHRSPTEDQIGL